MSSEVILSCRCFTSKKINSVPVASRNTVRHVRYPTKLMGSVKKIVRQKSDEDRDMEGGNT